MLLQAAAALEQHSHHPLAASIIGEAASRSLRWLEATEVVVLPGVGVEGLLGGQHVTLCNLREARRRTQCKHSMPPAVGDGSSGGDDTCSAAPCPMAASDVVASAVAQHVGSSVCLLVDGAWAGALILCDQPRPTAAYVVAALHSSGVRCAMLSGDEPLVAAKVGHRLGLDAAEVHGGLRPEQKVEQVRLLKGGSSTNPDASAEGAAAAAADAAACNDVEQGHRNTASAAAQRTHQGRSCCWRRLEVRSRQQQVVALVGDGINDAPALAAADVGVAMGVGGSCLAIEAADVALYTNDLTALVFLRGLARFTTRLIAANICFAIVVKLAVLVLIGLERASLVIAVSADVGSSLLVVLASLTVLRYCHPMHSSGQRGSKGGGCKQHHPDHGHSCCHNEEGHTHEADMRAEGHSCCHNQEGHTHEAGEAIRC